MTDTFKTYVITNPAQTSTSWSLGPTGLTGYDGFLYLLMGSGGQGSNLASTVFGGSSGFVNAGYVDLNYPYSVKDITVNLNVNSITTLSIGYTGPNIDPTNGLSHFVLTADAGQNYALNNQGGVFTEMTTGFYAPSNTFSPTGNPTLINQRGISSEMGSTGYEGAQGPVTDDFGRESGGTGILGGGGFYGGTVGPTGPFGFSSGGWYDVSGSTGTNGTLGYAIITLIPTSLVNNTHFLTGGTGTIGNTGIYLYSLLGGGGGGNNGGGGSGDIRHGFVNNTNNIDYNIGQGGLPNTDGGDTSITTDAFVNILTAVGGETAFLQGGGKGFFAGGFNGPTPTDGQSYANIPTNFSITADAAGSVDITTYGQGNGSGGGGGGPYGGNANTSGLGYGCGGGGQGPGHNGSGGYAILKQLIQNNFKYMNITSSTILLTPVFYGFTGVWGFMDAHLATSRSYFNTFHFLIKEDNVQRIDITKNLSGYFTTTISFSKLNNKTQQFTMTGTDPSPNMTLIFYV